MIIILFTGIILMFNTIFLLIILPIFSLIFLFTVFFFRIPNRKIIVKDGNIYAPCDGRIVKIKEVTETKSIKQP